MRIKASQGTLESQGVTCGRSGGSGRGRGRSRGTVWKE